MIDKQNKKKKKIRGTAVHLPRTKLTVIAICLGVVVTLAFNFLINLSVLIAGSVFTRLVLTFSVPISLVVDAVLLKVATGPLKIVGAVVIFLSVVGHEALDRFVIHRRQNKQKPVYVLINE